MGNVNENHKPYGKKKTTAGLNFNQNYQTIKRECLRSGRLFEDPSFPANFHSLFLDPQNEQRQFAIKWKRPHEISEHPKFFDAGGSRFDLNQGELGDCWVIAAAATLADHKELLKNVVPENQTFDKGDYAGIFLFRFFYFGKWVDVCVDDRLPTYDNKLVMVHSSETTEFWGALLEKAYAKLYGCYEALQGGVSSDSLSDFTGGIVETYRLKENGPQEYLPPQTNLPSMLIEAALRGSLICAGIWGDSSNNPVMPSGLVSGHAYTVVDAENVSVKNQSVTLVRVRNPWGNNVEWNGDWRDSSPLWSEIPPETKSKLKQKVANDGDFWMTAQDFVKHFDDVDICNLTPDSVESNKLRKWNAVSFYGAWKKGVSAGGRLKYRTFALNPQYAIDLALSTNEKLVSVVIELSQESQPKRPQDHLEIGFLIYKIQQTDHLPLTTTFFDRNKRVGGIDYYTNLRSVTKRFVLNPGRYVVIASSWEPGQEGNFLLRIWSESKVVQSKPLSDLPAVTPASNQNGTNGLPGQHDLALQSFKTMAGEDLQISAFDLHTGLNQLYSVSPKYNFDIDCCRSMILLLDVGGHYKLNLDQFLTLFQTIDNWTQKFKSHDAKMTGYLNFFTYTVCLMELNVAEVDKKLLNYLSFRYTDGTGKVSYSNFIHSLIKLSTAVGLESEYGYDSERSIVSLEDWGA